MPLKSARIDITSRMFGYPASVTMCILCILHQTVQDDIPASIPVVLHKAVAKVSEDRKPIGEVGCCESWMAERTHWWIERWLECRAIYLSIYLKSICLYPSIYLSIYLSETKQFCETSSRSESSQLQGDEIRETSSIFEIANVKFCEASVKNGKLSPTALVTKKWGKVIRSAAPVMQNHLSKPEDLMLQNATLLRKSAAGPPI